MDNNLLESLLDLEEDFYKEGYDLGAADGAEAGYTEGSVFAVEKGFEKFVELGRLYGKALVWAQRLVDVDSAKNGGANDISFSSCGPTDESIEEGTTSLGPSTCKRMVNFPHSSRLAKNLDTLLELVDPASLPMQNTEEAVTDADERLKGATIKVKLIQRALGECEDGSDIHPDARGTQQSGDGTGSIEDISSLKIRH
ncbi:Yae1 family protein [Aspergillus lucknowensis]|uniref:Essential protein Yae1 N-terminal domain-containing protein n=1 Tax=Aspergillus lucknowensis TaxID=176173 RepID=A0ABR4M6J8_9EURO